jgi:uncharacterized protein (TIGR03435 family)
MRRGLLIAFLSSAAFGQSAFEAFDTADVHVSVAVANPQMRGGALRGGRFEVRTATMVDLISFAYDMEPDKVLAGPSWLDWERFDVAAKAPPATTRENLMLMAQKLLADRFQLVVHQGYEADAGVCAHSRQRQAEDEGSGRVR